MQQTCSVISFPSSDSAVWLLIDLSSFHSLHVWVGLYLWLWTVHLYQITHWNLPHWHMLSHSMQSLCHDTIWTISKKSSLQHSPSGQESAEELSRGSSAKPSLRLRCEPCSCVINQHHQDKVQLARKQEYREEAQRGIQALKWSRCFPVVHPHALPIPHNADEDNIAPFTSPAPSSFQDPVYHMPSHSTSFKVILACHFPQKFLEAMYGPVVLSLPLISGGEKNHMIQHRSNQTFPVSLTCFLWFSNSTHHHSCEMSQNLSKCL